ncbi:MAG: hypothetical protein COW01_09670 [Bdellovibrionales bacterium CG12_big_fil_rev_8_21_14_0_65_38_15]|nr:MAG: hypothetical protein COW01_09670 [Bdellovibrionales bacterium CG12_big_fil_rev_8_21_14_0_65_38_15]PIR29136.1 MAG: hypothetical protein COV38_12930 [Bdellovibrionales bacterium CG11_big_fil_rev_8_21_14_0_20_38_13]
MNAELFARETFELKIGENVQVLSDKAFRDSAKNKFEAVGNVIITHQKNSIYGERASLDFNTGQTTVVGNVRYVGPDMTMYGSEMLYNFRDKSFSLGNARILADNYIVLGKKLSRPEPKTVIGIDAEYTTCKDCPESWSIFGREIEITLGEYVRIKHAYLKVKGVVVMYVPYIIFPIKKKRETGLLFPSFGFEFEEGFRFQQPWFWAINDSADMTFTPSVFGRRGLGHQYQYRQVFHEDGWVNLDTLKVLDEVYQPGKQNEELSGDKVFRHFTQAETHWSSGEHFNGHFRLLGVNDLDMMRDYDFFTQNLVDSTEIGMSGFLETRTSMLNLAIDGDFQNNTLFNDPKGFDHRYVQILPKVSLSTSPVTLLQTKIPLIRKFSFGLESDFSVFKQNHYAENLYIRNARRLNSRPYINWELGNLGPVNFRTRVAYDSQKYWFPNESEKTFSKSGVFTESEISFEVEKIFGMAYTENIPVEKVDVAKLSKPTEKSVVNKNLIGELPAFNEGLSKENFVIRRNAYRHSQEFKVKHYYFSDQRTKGNARFLNQISQNTGDGQFDAIDALRSREFLVSNTETRTTLPLSNTVEIQWNNSLVRKKAVTDSLLIDGRSLTDNFSYDRVSYFNVSQGYDLDRKSEEINENLTRLKIDTGITINSFNFGFNEFFFYDTSEHIFSFNISKDSEKYKIFTRFIYDSLTTPVKKLATLGTKFNVVNLFLLGAELQYDLEDKRYASTQYSMLYKPRNECWEIDLRLKRDLVEKRVSVNFLLNFNDKGSSFANF